MQQRRSSDLLGLGGGCCSPGPEQLLYLLLLPVPQGDGVEQIADKDGLLPVFVGLVEAN